jgi:hypothetical protein
MASSDFDPNSAINGNEEMCRFVFFRSNVRIDGTLKPEAFMPNDHLDTSVTRHNNLGDRKIWIRGNNVARQTQGRLIGRGDVFASAYRVQGLHINPAPVPCNPQHANVANWPADKPSQKIRAQLIAKESTFKPSIQISDSQATSRLGEFVIIKGIVAEIVTTHKANMLFNFGSVYPHQTFTAWIHRKAPFLNDPALKLQGKAVQIIGKIETYNGKPEICVSSRSQILEDG